MACTPAHTHRIGQLLGALARRGHHAGVCCWLSAVLPGPAERIHPWRHTAREPDAPEDSQHARRSGESAHNSPVSMAHQNVHNKLLFALVARGSVVLAEHQNASTNANLIALRILEKLGGEDT